jgi:hypothetical protein
MSKRESPLMQELGPKKFYQKVDRENAFYDKYKAGKIDPKTGIKNKEIFFEDPRKSKISSGSTINSFPCPYCLTPKEVTRRLAGVICSECKKYISIKVDPITEDIFIEGELLTEEWVENTVKRVMELNDSTKK